MSQNIQFEWILGDVGSHSYRPSTHDRAVIRRQAGKKSVDTRRQRGDHGQINPGQYRILTSSENEDSLSSTPTEATARPLQPQSHEMTISKSTTSDLQLLPKLAPKMPLSGLAKLIATTGVDLLQLSSLTSTHVGHAAVAFFRNRANRLVTLIRRPKMSYLHHIIRRYGESPCLDEAVHTLMLKTRELLEPDCRVSRNQILLHHGRALVSLQRAINVPKTSVEADVLCATEILGLIEILNWSEENAWTHHVSGAASLIQARGSYSFKSDYENDLLLSLVGPIICEAVRTNNACFLQESRWQAVLDQSIIPQRSDIISDRSSLTVTVRKVLSRLPGYFKRVSSIVCHGSHLPADKLFPLIENIRAFRHEMLDLHTRLIKLFPWSPVISPACPDITLGSELLGTSLMALATANRLLAAMGDSQDTNLETDALKYVHELGELEGQFIAANHWVSFYLHQKQNIASSILKTTTIWRPLPGQIIEKWQFDSWCKALERNICNCTGPQG